MLRESMGRKMTSKEEQDVQFYRGSAVHEYVKKLSMSDAEKKVVNAAIATAQTKNPNLALIQESDALLNKIAEEKRTVKVTQVSDKDLARAVADVNMSKYKAPPSSFTAPRESNATYRWVSGLLVVAVVAAIVSYAMDHQGKYTYQEAIDKCSEKNQVLPITIADFVDSGYRFGQPAEFWTAKGTLMVSQAWSIHQANPDSAGYSYICVDANGKEWSPY